MKSKQHPCPLCSHDRTKEILAPEGSFLKCKQCSAIFLDPAHSFEDEEAYYSENYYDKEFKGRADTSVFMYRLPLLFSAVPSPASLLEVGAASGDFLSLLKEYGYDVYGVELSKRAVEVGKQKYSLSIDQGDLYGAHYDDERYDAVMMYHVLEHVPDPKALLKEIHRILRKGGKLIIEVPNPSSIDAKLSSHLKGSIYDYPNHSFLFSPSLLKKLVEEAGFTIEYLETSFSYFIVQKIKALVGIMRGKKNQSGEVLQKQSVNQNVPHYRDSMSKKILRRLFPGMKITCIAVKK